MGRAKRWAISSSEIAMAPPRRRAGRPDRPDEGDAGEEDLALAKLPHAAGLADLDEFGGGVDDDRAEGGLRQLLA